MRYAEKVMLHQMVQQTFIERKAYDVLSDGAERRLWFMKKSQILGSLSDIIERYEFENQVIRKIADRERSELTSKKDLNEESSRLYRECYCTFPLEDMRDITGVEIERNRTRKFRKRSDHLFRASLVRDGLYTDWTIGKGRKRKQEEIFEWRKSNPEGSKYACAKELGISKPTVMKWWDTTEENLEEERLKWEELMKRKSKVQSIEAERKDELVEGYELHDRESSELHDIRAGYNRGYLADRKVADLVMHNTAGYEDQSEETIRKTGDDLADLINFSEVSMDAIMKAMGIPEPMIPMLKTQMREAMKTPEFWAQYKAANPTVDTSKWPKEIQDLYNKKMKDN